MPTRPDVVDAHPVEAASPNIPAAAARIWPRRPVVLLRQPSVSRRHAAAARPPCEGVAVPIDRM